MTSLFAKGVSLEGRLAPADLGASDGEMIAVVGPNGGGKTSLLRALARVERAGGHVTIDGETLDKAPEARRRQLLAFLPASRDIGWPISTYDVIALGLSQADPKRIEELLDRFELGPLARRPVNRLSTGERSRVQMARALAARPRLLLLDEPLSNLDPYWVLRFLALLRIEAEAGHIVLVSLHDLSLIQRFDRAVLIADGRLQMDETPASLMASERFEEIFRVQRSVGGNWAIRQADRQSSP